MHPQRVDLSLSRPLVLLLVVGRFSLVLVQVGSWFVLARVVPVLVVCACARVLVYVRLRVISAGSSASLGSLASSYCSDCYLLCPSS